MTIDLTRLSGKTLIAYWYDPRSGTAEMIGTVPRRDRREFTPPTQGPEHDWILVLDDMSRGFPPPGTPP